MSAEIDASIYPILANMKATFLISSSVCIASIVRIVYVATIQLTDLTCESC
jgi:hypothetical protein